MLIAVWAMDQTGAIGYKNRLPWYIKLELQHFKTVTLHQNILMGRKTFDHLPVKPLPDRTNFVVTHQKQLDYNNKNIHVVHELNSFILRFVGAQKPDLYVCGGASIYKACWSHFDRLIVSKVKGTFQGDVYFPALKWDDYALIKTAHHDEFDVCYYERITK